MAISLRLYVRLKSRLWGWDDMFVFGAGVRRICPPQIPIAKHLVDIYHRWFESYLFEYVHT